MSIEELNEIILVSKANLARLEKFRDELLGKSGSNIELLSDERMKEFIDLVKSTSAGEEQIVSRVKKNIPSMERHLVCWIAKNELKIHEATIGHLLGGRERTTVIKSLTVAENMIKYPSTVPHYCEKLFNRILKFKENESSKQSKSVSKR
jgi:hypothetical protein